MRSSHRTARILLPFTLLTSALALNATTYVGCFSSSSGLTEDSTYQYQSSGYCQQTCVDNNNQAVLGLTSGDDCWCGSSVPPTSAKVSDSKCNTPCTGYGQDSCGGTNYWSVYLTGTEADVGNAGASSSSASSSAAASSTSASTAASSSAAAQSSNSPTTTTSQPSVVTSITPGKTVVVTEAASVTQSAAPTTTDTTSHKSGGSNTVGIAVGVVVGVLAVAAIAAGLFFFMRHRRKQQADVERKSEAATFAAAAAPPRIPATRKSSGPDSRIDPDAMAQRRLSDGSIADNEDYSRRILKVTNPDDRFA